MLKIRDCMARYVLLQLLHFCLGDCLREAVILQADLSFCLYGQASHFLGRKTKNSGTCFDFAVSLVEQLFGKSVPVDISDLMDRHATAHPSVMSHVNNMATGARVVIDGQLITSKGCATATHFALAIVSKRFGVARARSVAEGLVLEHPR